MSQPLVSAILTCHDDKDTVCDALRSIWTQTYRNLEILIVDDGSSDGSGDAIQSCIGSLIERDKSRLDRWSYLYQESKGPSGARNAGISRANGEFVAFLDADDEWETRKIETQVALIRETEFCLVSGNFRYVDNGNRVPCFLTKKDRQIIDFNAALFRYYFTPSCVLVRKKTIVDAGMFPENQHYVEDGYAFAACLRGGRAILTKDFVATKSGKPGRGKGLSGNHRAMNQGETRNLARLFKENDAYGKRTNAAVFLAAFGFLFLRRIRRAVMRIFG
jgi:glycosyltransferase involved in cell wall biosynthesis